MDHENQRCNQHDWLSHAHDDLPRDTIVQAVEGFRSWKVDQDDPFLHSQFYNCSWEPHKKVVATCMSGQYCCAGRCDAGIYATKGPILDFLATSDPNGSSYCILGKVWLWGRILECEEGYRAEFAYPSLIYDTHHRSAEFAGRYGVPLLPRVPFIGNGVAFLPSGMRISGPILDES